MSDNLREELVALASDMVRFSSTADRPDQLAAAMDYAARYLDSIPGLHIHRSEAEGKPAIVATLRETRAPALMLNAHLDVVAARPEQFVPELRDGRIYGRATQDMKGSAAVMLRLARDLAALAEPPDVGFQFVSDEEIGGDLGTGRLLSEGWRCGFFVALEPTDMQICYEQKGIMWIELRLPGEAAHGSRPWEGRNPIMALGEGLARLAARFPQPASEAWQTTVTPTVVHAGAGARNQVPAAVDLTLDVRYPGSENPDGMLAAILECFASAEVTVNKRAAPLATSRDDPAVQGLAAACARVRGVPTPLYREHFGSDARFYSAAGIPAVCFGPIGAGLHSDEEWVAIESLVELYQTLRTYIATR